SPFEIVENVVIRGNSYRRWKYAPETIRDMLEASRDFGDRECILYVNPWRNEEVRLSYTQLYEKSSVFANALRDEFGVRKGDRVAVAMRNYPEFVVAFWAIASIGAIIVPVNDAALTSHRTLPPGSSAWLLGHELLFCITDAGSKVLIVDGERIDRLLSHLSNLAHPAGPTHSIILARPDDGDHAPNAGRPGAINKYGVKMWDDVVARHGQKRELPGRKECGGLERDDDAASTLLTHLGFTTSILNRQIGSARNIIRTAPDPHAALTEISARIPKPTDKKDKGRKQGCVLVTNPLFHVTALIVHLGSGVDAGNKMIFMYKWDAGEGLKIIEKERVTSVGMVPAVAHQILNHPSFPHHDTSSIISFGYGGGPAPPSLVEHISRTWPAASVNNGYGLTETSGGVISNLDLEYKTKPGSIGVPYPVTDVKVVGADGKEVPVGEVGEIWAKS
ncbi:hypothetical protein HDU93_002921, partial [Gonapodya sp. JEL0774]